MGNTDSHGGFAKDLHRLGDYDQKTAQLLHRKYLELDLEFGIDSGDLTRLLKAAEVEADDNLVRAIMKSFPNKEILNVLDFLEGFCFLCKGSPEEKLSGCFDIFDFQTRGEISFDELTIMLMSLARGIKFLQGKAADEMDDDAVANMLRKDLNQQQGMEADVSKQQYLAWAKEKAPPFDAPIGDFIDFCKGTPCDTAEKAEVEVTNAQTEKVKSPAKEEEEETKVDSEATQESGPSAEEAKDPSVSTASKEIPIDPHGGGQAHPEKSNQTEKKEAEEAENPKPSGAEAPSSDLATNKEQTENGQEQSPGKAQLEQKQEEKCEEETKDGRETGHAATESKDPAGATANTEVRGMEEQPGETQVTDSKGETMVAREAGLAAPTEEADEGQTKGLDAAPEVEAKSKQAEEKRESQEEEGSNSPSEVETKPEDVQTEPVRDVINENETSLQPNVEGLDKQHEPNDAKPDGQLITGESRAETANCETEGSPEAAGENENKASAKDSSSETNAKADKQNISEQDQQQAIDQEEVHTGETGDSQAEQSKAHAVGTQKKKEETDDIGASESIEKTDEELTKDQNVNQTDVGQKLSSEVQGDIETETEDKRTDEVPPAKQSDVAPATKD